MTSMSQGSAAVAYRARAVLASTSDAVRGRQSADRIATRRGSLELAVVPSAVRTARHWAASLLAESDPPRDADVIDAVVLCVSELVTNAIRAVGQQSDQDKMMPPGSSPVTRPRVWLAICGSSNVVRIEVHDSTCAPIPPARHRADDEESGRGLEVIAALASDWGWQADALGKFVWCELASSG